MTRPMTGASGVPDRLRVDLLGPLRLWRPDGPVDPGPRMQRALVTVLAVNAGRAVSVDRLVDDLWGGDPPAAAAATLQAYVSQLRRVLEPDRPPRAPATILVTVDPGYALMVAPAAIDLFVFEDLARRGRSELAAGDLDAADRTFAAATELWRGDALAEFSTEHWASGMTARLREGLAVVVEDHMDIRLARGEHAEAIGQLEMAVAEHPLRERRWAQLLLALYRSGRQADALRTYQRCREVLAGDLGIDPGPELRLLERRVLEQDPSLLWVPPAPPTAAVAAAAAAPAPAATARDASDARTGSASRSSDIAETIDGPAAAGGRNAQRARLRERIDGLPRGGGVVILVGEPGIGKTTLAESAIGEASSAGWITGWVRCPDDGTSPPYWPWTQLLRDLPTDDGGAVAVALRNLGGTDALPEDQPAAQFAMAQLVLAALRSVATVAPVVLVLDDLHAADGPSQAVLATIAGDLHRAFVLLIITARDNEGSAHFDQMLGDLTRHRGVERLFVPPLLRDEVRSAAHRALDAAPSAELVDALHARTGGNPFYLNEVVRMLSSEHRSLAIEVVASLDVPANVRDVLARRLARLPDGTRSLLALASVIGRDIDLDLLQTAASIDTEQLMFALEPAVAAGLLAQDGDSWSYRFRHGIAQESIYAAISRSDQGRLHARVAESLEQIVSGQPAERATAIAHHLVEAGPFADPTTAVTWCRRAAEFARRQGAWTQAARLLSAALTFLRSPERSSAELRCELLIELGRDRRHAGDVSGAHQALSHAIALAGELDDDPMIARAAALFGQVTPWGSRLYGQYDSAVIAVLEAQLARVGERDPEMRARLLAALGCELYYTDRNADGERYAHEAIVLARELDDPELLGLALTNWWQASNFHHRASQARAATRETLALVGRGLSKRTELATRIHHLGELACLGNLADYDIELSRCRQLAADLHSPELDAHIGWATVSRALFDGRWDDAERLGADAYDRMRRTSAPGTEWSRVALQVAVARGRGRLGELSDQLHARCDDPEFKMFRPAVVLGHLEAGRIETAKELVARWTEPVAQDWAWMLGTACWAAVAARLGAPDPQPLFDALTPYSGELAITGIALDCGGSVDALLADLARRLGRLDDARRLARSALELERRSGLRAWMPRTSQLIEELDADAQHP